MVDTEWWHLRISLLEKWHKQYNWMAVAHSWCFTCNFSFYINGDQRLHTDVLWNSMRKVKTELAVRLKLWTCDNKTAAATMLRNQQVMRWLKMDSSTWSRWWEGCCPTIRIMFTNCGPVAWFRGSVMRDDKCGTRECIVSLLIGSACELWQVSKMRTRVFRESPGPIRGFPWFGWETSWALVVCRTKHVECVLSTVCTKVAAEVESKYLTCAVNLWSAPNKWQS